MWRLLEDENQEYDPPSEPPEPTEENKNDDDDGGLPTENETLLSEENKETSAPEVPITLQC